MNVSVLLFASVRDAIGENRIEMEVADGATVASVFAELAARHPKAAGMLSTCRAAVDGEFAASGETLSPDCKVAVLPPVSGG